MGCSIMGCRAEGYAMGAFRNVDALKDFNTVTPCSGYGSFATLLALIAGKDWWPVCSADAAVQPETDLEAVLGLRG